MTEERRQLLRLVDEWKARAYNEIGGRYGGKLTRDKKDPPDVKHARNVIKRFQKVVDKHERKCAARHKRAISQIDEVYSSLRTAAFFEKPAALLARLKRIPNQSR